MQTSPNNRTPKINHRQVQASATLNRRYARQSVKSSDGMVKINRSPKVQRFYSPMPQTVPVTPVEEPIAPPVIHPMQATANQRMQSRMNHQPQPVAPKVTARQLKDQAIQKALASASTIQASEEQSGPAESPVKSKKLKSQIHFGIGRIALATACAAAAVFAIIYFVNLNMPDISLRVAAMQTGMDPSYPNYVPRDYNISSVTAENGRISMNFVNNASNTSFTLIEEKSSWDSNALLSNYVKNEYGDNYNIIREQGLTIYISGGDAAWVNGGKVFKIKADASDLTNKQIRSIATSL